MTRRAGNARADGRRLDLGAALRAGLTTMPRMYGEAWGALAFCVVAGVLPVLAPLTGAAAGVAVLFQGLAVLIAWGALTRISLTRDLGGAQALGLGPAGLQLGAGEGRIVAALLLNLIFLAILATVTTLLLLGVAGASDLDAEAIAARDWAAAGTPLQLAVVGAVALIALGVPLLFAVRLSLFAHASLGRGQVVSLNTLGVAEGSFWPLLLLLIVVALPRIALAALSAQGVLTGAAGQIAGVLVLVLVQVPFAAGAMGEAYRRLEYWTPGMERST
ncbi:MAG: hypothetical protein ACK5QD_12655 [Brevundimonas sp.]|uniref:hypothetical protein n=1 Tax=Brevundimonas sp. TaxID=1871086 RepID=UPI0022C56D18|nr:hypothetical protein [Brevundimonas sp.]MCZ8193277.1 hypothetical protein [Brevundimonas sp.]